MIRSMMFEARHQADKARSAMGHRVGRAVPDRIAYWVLIAQGSKHINGPTRPDEVVSEVTFMTVLHRSGSHIERRIERAQAKMRKRTEREALRRARREESVHV